MKTVDLSHFTTEIHGALEKAEERTASKERKPAEERKTCKVTTNLTPSEKTLWKMHLDGRPEAQVLRDMILERLSK